MCREIRVHLVDTLYDLVGTKHPFNLNYLAAYPYAGSMTRQEINEAFWRAASDTGEAAATISQLKYYVRERGDVDYRPGPDQPTVAEQLLMTAPATDNGERAAFIVRCREKNEKK